VPSQPQRRHKKGWRFYTTATGRAIAREELDELRPDARAAVVEAIQRRRWGEQLHHEEEHLRGRLHAIRVSYDGCNYRVFYASVGKHDEILLGLVVFEKKGQKVARTVLRTAEKRLEDWEARGVSGSS
jgi:phage-related protein